MLLKRAPVTCQPHETIAAASRIMTAQQATSVIVLGPEGRPQGIVTDRDLRERVIALGRSPDDPVATIMTTPLVTISPEAFVVEAVLEMSRRGIHHLLVVEGGQPLGVITGDDLLRLEASRPLELARALRASTSLSELATLMPELAAATRQLFEQGLSGYELGRIAAEMNDIVIQQVLGLAEQELRETGHGPPPVPFCWLALGSEGRREQTLRTDQDNALVYEDPTAAIRGWAERYFREIAQRTIAGLIRLGYPRCPADAMASNPKWCQPLAGWRRYFDEWAHLTTPRNLMDASIHLDFRSVAGEARLALDLREALRAEVRAWRSFPRYLAKIAVSHAPPLGWFGRLKRQRRNGRRGINVKLGGLLLLNNALRAYAIELGLEETNTLERLEAAARLGACFTAAEVEDVRQAYETIFHLRLRHQLAQLAAGTSPDNFVDPQDLSVADQRRLAGAFRAIRYLQGKVEDRYLTEMLQ
jgi:CBS domain-containing protein